MLRGGSWAFGPSYARSALRNRVEPTFRYVDTGFRVALSAPEATGSEGHRVSEASQKRSSERFCEASLNRTYFGLL